PPTDEFDAISKRVHSQNKRRAPSKPFLKKMGAGTSATMDMFVKIKTTPKQPEPEANVTVYDNEEDNRFDETLCDTCNVPLIYLPREASNVCPSCGNSTFHQEITQDDMMRQGYQTSPSYLYKRSNHFSSWLLRTQAKENTVIDQDVLKSIVSELRKERIDDFTTIRHVKIREILKKLRLNKYYNHCVQITSIVSGRDPPRMSAEQEHTLLKMFDMIQIPFQEIVADQDRQNMLSYSFLLHKFIEIMEWDEFLPFFPMLVSADKMAFQDAIWKKICQKVGFQYIKSTM
ncbi:unnamed protein product, partial [Phaeothamnion confervicola]